MQRSKQVSDLKVGDLVVRAGKRVFDGTVLAIEPARAGLTAVGPRGGGYELTAAGGREYLIVTIGSAKPLLLKKSFVTVEVDE